MTKSSKIHVSWQHISRVVREEVSGFHPRIEVFRLVSALRPRWTPQRRAQWMSQIGFRIGADTQFETTPQITGNRKRILENLVIGNECVIGANCVFDLQERITIGDRVTLGPGTMLLTSTHELGPQSHRAGVVTLARVVIQDGAWVRARAIILPGVTIGKGAIVEVGAVVNKDVAEHTRVGGVPATQLESLVKP